MVFSLYLSLFIYNLHDNLDSEAHLDTHICCHKNFYIIFFLMSMLCSVVGYHKGWWCFHPQQQKTVYIWRCDCVPLCFKNDCWLSLTVIFRNAKFHSNNTDNDDTSINFPRHFPNHGLLEHSAGERKEKEKEANLKQQLTECNTSRKILGPLQTDKASINKKFLYTELKHLEKKWRENKYTYQFHMVRKCHRGENNIRRISIVNNCWVERTKQVHETRWKCTRI